MRIALAQVNPTVGALEANAALVIERMREAEAAGADLVAFPELVISGYPPEDLLLKDHFLGRCWSALLAGGGRQPADVRPCRRAGG